MALVHSDDNYIIILTSNSEIALIPTWYDSIDGKGDIENRYEKLISERV